MTIGQRAAAAGLGASKVNAVRRYGISWSGAIDASPATSSAHAPAALTTTRAEISWSGVWTSQRAPSRASVSTVWPLSTRRPLRRAPLR